MDGPSAIPARIDRDHGQRLHRQSGADAWQVSLERFGQALASSLAHRYGPDLPADRGRAYLDSLHLSDLALAAACIDGHDGAWEHFVRELRPSLYHAARTIAGDSGRELADSLYADLFGLPGPDGRRRSLLSYYHGRSRLLTWLRSVLVQRHIDRHRATRRLATLDEQRPEEIDETRPQEVDPDRDRLIAATQRALDVAIDALAPQDRLRLRLYYGQDMTLAAIGRVLGEHEATTSRKLEKARHRLKQEVERALASEGLSVEARGRAFELAADAPDLQLDRLLSRSDDG